MQSDPNAIFLRQQQCPPALSPTWSGAVPQSEAVVQLRGSRICVATLPVTWQWLSPPQSPWSIQSVSGSAAVTRRKKSWSLWNCVGWRAAGVKRLAGEKWAPEPIAVFLQHIAISV